MKLFKQKKKEKKKKGKRIRKKNRKETEDRASCVCLPNWLFKRRSRTRRDEDGLFAIWGKALFVFPLLLFCAKKFFVVVVVLVVPKIPGTKKRHQSFLSIQVVPAKPL